MGRQKKKEKEKKKEKDQKNGLEFNHVFYWRLTAAWAGLQNGNVNEIILTKKKKINNKRSS